jgi:hypothetical protein
VSEPTQPDEVPTPSTNDVPADLVQQALAWFAANPTDHEALPQLNELGEVLLRPEFAAAVLTAAESVTRPVLEMPSVGPAERAHMVILFSLLLRIPSGGARVDKLFAAWLRHPSSFGSGRSTPPAFQRAEFMQRVADLLGWGELDATRDADALSRFVAWVNDWAPKNKHRVRRTFDAVRRNFPAPDVWKHLWF